MRCMLDFLITSKTFLVVTFYKSNRKQLPIFIIKHWALFSKSKERLSCNLFHNLVRRHRHFMINGNYLHKFDRHLHAYNPVFQNFDFEKYLESTTLFCAIVNHIFAKSNQTNDITKWATR